MSATPTTPVPPSPPLGGGAGTSCAHVAAPGLVCHCGHVEELHDLARNKTRTVCSFSSGPKATPCGCPKFAEEMS